MPNRPYCRVPCALLLPSTSASNRANASGILSALAVVVIFWLSAEEEVKDLVELCLKSLVHVAVEDGVDGGAGHAKQVAQDERHQHQLKFPLKQKNCNSDSLTFKLPEVAVSRGGTSP